MHPKLGSVLYLEQQHGVDWRPIAYWSRKLRDPETRYSATDLEWLAVVAAVTRVWPWMLEGRPFTICSDHKALERKLHKSVHDPPLNDRQARWIESLAPFSYTFQWIKGESNPVADALSRNPATCCAVTVVHSLLAGLRKRIKYLAKDDPEYQGLVQQAKDHVNDMHNWHGLIVDGQGRIMVPADDEIRTLIISEAHDSPMAGHFGMDRTIELVQRQWNWKGLRADVRAYVRSCLLCQRAKHSVNAPPGKLHPIVAERPWQIVTMDFVGKFPKTPVNAHTQILIMVDKFTKYVMLEPCGDEVNAADTAEIFLRRVVGDHGVPSVVISDRGTQFASDVWKAILRSLGSRVAMATTHHPQTDGQSERAIQTLVRLLRAYVQDLSTSWAKMLPLLQFAMNNSVSSASQLSPFQLMYGREPMSPVHLMLDQLDDRPGGMELKGNRKATVWARDWWKARRKLCKYALANLQEGARRVKRRYDKKRAVFLAEPGDLVLLSTKSHPAFGTDARKLRLRFTGPYVIVQKIHENAYALDGLPPAVPVTQNVSHLRLFHPSPPQFESRPHPGHAVGPVMVKDHREWEVEAIEGHREVNNKEQYLIRWKDHAEPSWLRVNNLRNCSEMLRDYQKENDILLSFWSSECASSPESAVDNPQGPATDSSEDGIAPVMPSDHPSQPSEEEGTEVEILITDRPPSEDDQIDPQPTSLPVPQQQTQHQDPVPRSVAALSPPSVPSLPPSAPMTNPTLDTQRVTRSRSRLGGVHGRDNN